MAITLATGTAQALATPTHQPLAPDAGAFAYSKDDPGESVLMNIEAALDQPNSIRYAVSKVADVFKGTPATPNQGQRVDGNSHLVQLNEVWKAYDDADTSVVAEYLPVSAHLVLKLPTHALITGALVETLLLRLLGAVQRNATDDLDVALAPLLHGITNLGLSVES